MATNVDTRDSSLSEDIPGASLFGRKPVRTQKPGVEILAEV